MKYRVMSPLDDDELGFVVLKQQDFTLILVVFLDDSDEVLDLVISILCKLQF